MPAPKEIEDLFAELRREIAELRRNQGRLTGSGLSVPGPGVVQVDGSLVVQGGDAKSGNYDPGVAGWHLPASGAAEFTDIVILGVPVGDDAPVLTRTYRVSANGFALSTGWVEKAGLDIVVPEGCTRANVGLSGRLYAVNQNTSGGADTTGTDALYVRVGIDGQFTTATPTGVSGNYGFATNNGADSFDLTDLTPGSTIRLSAQGTTGYQAIASYPDNYINGVASITWMR